MSFEKKDYHKPNDTFEVSTSVNDSDANKETEEVITAITAGVPGNQVGADSSENVSRAFVTRTYERPYVQFSTDLPALLAGKIVPHDFKSVIARINTYFEAAESFTSEVGWTNLSWCLCGYFCALFYRSKYEMCMAQMSDFVEERNKKLFQPAGMKLINPLQRGLRIIEIEILPGLPQFNAIAEL
eukprot:m.7478 g.7478  ORF g.7478 m.7478 type:complete len:185 (-) comp3720_c0_seq2:101-655(-)